FGPGVWALLQRRRSQRKCKEKDGNRETIALARKEKRMLYTRRDIGRIAVAAGAASRLMGAAKPNSNFGGVQIGTITYSFRALPSGAEQVLQYCLDCGISAIELMSNVVEGYAGAPAQAGRGFGPPPGGPGRGPGAGQGQGLGRGRGGRAPLTPEQQAAMQK